MINIDSLTIKAFIEENKNFFIGAKVQKIQQPTRRDLIFSLRNFSYSKKFYINIHPNFFHICFISKENEKKRNIQIPKVAPMFCMLLRKYLENSKIININQPSNERIIELHFQSNDEYQGVTDLCLAIELMGKHSNIILYNLNSKIILGCIHNVSEEKSKERELAGLLPYVYPKPKLKNNLLTTDFQEFKSLLITNISGTSKIISDNFYYISHDLSKKVLNFFKFQSNNDTDKLNEIYSYLKKCILLENLSPTIAQDLSDYSIFNFCSEQKSSVNDVIDSYYAQEQFRFLFSNMYNKIKNTFDKDLKKLNLQINNLNNQLLTEDKSYLYKKYADLLMANQYYLKDNVKNIIILQDFNSSDNIKIPVDPSLSIVQNANIYYKKYNKNKTSIDFAKKRLKFLMEQSSFIEEQLFYLNLASSFEDLDDIFNKDTISSDNNYNGKNISKNKVNNRNVKKDKTDKKEIPILKIDEYIAYIGKNSRQNDYILSKLSSPYDIWFHIKDAPSAHLLLKTFKNTLISEDVIFKAAKAVKEISVGVLSSKVSVIYTLRKYVNKSTQKGLAFVTYSNEKEIVID